MRRVKVARTLHNLNFEKTPVNEEQIKILEFPHALISVDIYAMNHLELVWSPKNLIDKARSSAKMR